MLLGTGRGWDKLPLRPVTMVLLGQEAGACQPRGVSVTPVYPPPHTPGRDLGQGYLLVEQVLQRGGPPFLHEALRTRTRAGFLGTG